MMDHPEILERAQRELDAVVRGRLPDFDDEDSLPFVTAIVLESLRYMPVTPVVGQPFAWQVAGIEWSQAIAHYYSGDGPDIYKEYAIPPKSVVIPNVWCVASSLMR